jgi:hypothetical protein
MDFPPSARGLRREVLLDVADHHLRAGRGEGLRHPRAEALRATGDERMPTRERVLSHLSPLVAWTATDPTTRP